MGFIYYKCNLFTDVNDILLKKGIDSTSLERKLRENCPYREHNSRSTILWNTIRLTNYVKQTLDDFCLENQLDKIYLSNVYFIDDPNSYSGLIVYMLLTLDKEYYMKCTGLVQT